MAIIICKQVSYFLEQSIVTFLLIFFLNNLPKTIHNILYNIYYIQYKHIQTHILYILDFEFIFFSRYIILYFLSITNERDPIIPPCGRTDSKLIGIGNVEFL